MHLYENYLTRLMNFGMHIAIVKKKSTKKDELEKKNVSGKKLPVILIYPILTNNLKLFYMSFTEAEMGVALTAHLGASQPR